MEPKSIENPLKNRCEKMLISRLVFPRFLLIFGSPAGAYLPSVRKVNCRKTTKRKEKEKEKGTVQDREQCCPSLTRSRAAAHARGGFFDVDSEGQKIEKNRTLEPQGPKKVQRPFAGTSLGGSMAPGRRPIIKEIRGKKDQGLRRRS